MPTEKEYMLEEATAAATYQPKLTAGRNINISENNVISSPDPPPPGSTVTVTPNQMSGNLIATVTVDSTSYNLYSPIPQVMTGATSQLSGAQGLVPAPSIGYQDYVLYGDGTWKDPEIPNIIANPAVSATTDLTKIYIDGTVYEISSGSAGSEVVECTQDEYDALPSSKLTDNKIYCISGTKELDSNYNYYKYGENDEIVVRVYHEGESDENIVWFFNGWNQTVLYETIPSSLASYAPDYDAGVILSANYPNGGTVQDGWIGFYQSTIRAWNQGKGDNVTGIEYGVVVVTNGAAEQLNPYEDDPYIWISSSIKKIIVNGTEYANTGGGGSGAEVIPNPQDQPTDILESIGIDGTVYELPGADKSIPLFKEGQWLNQDIIEITPYLATIENNKLHCQGLHCGIVVSNIISLSDAVYYSITIKVSSTNGFGFQIGQCVPTTNLDGIIGSGANKITYNNESSFDSGELTITTYNNTNGIFLGGYYQDVNTDYYIEEISLLKITVVKKEYT